MTLQTPVYGLKYIEQGEPLRNARPALEASVKSIEAALIAGGIAPPNAADLATLAGRVSALEIAGNTDSLSLTYANVGADDASTLRTGQVAVPSWAIRSPAVLPAAFTISGGTVTVTKACMLNVYWSAGIQAAAASNIDSTLRHVSGGVTTDIVGPYFAVAAAGIGRSVSSITRKCAAGDTLQIIGGASTGTWGYRASTALRLQRII